MADNENKEQSGYSSREVELVQELLKERMESGKTLAYEQLDDYEIPPRQQFPMLKKPTLTIRYGKMNCNMAAIRLFEGVKYVLPMVCQGKHRVAICPCREEESGSVEWARQQKSDGKWVNKDITCPDVIEKIYNFMGWEKECRYKMHGELRNSREGLILVFELDESVLIDPKKEEYVDPVTGETKKRQVKYYPDYYKNRIGRSYNDYVRAKQMSLFEDAEAYSSLTQMAAEEPVLSETADTIQAAEEIYAVDNNHTTEDVLTVDDHYAEEAVQAVETDNVVENLSAAGPQMSFRMEDLASYEYGQERLTPRGGMNGQAGIEA